MRWRVANNQGMSSISGGSPFQRGLFDSFEKKFHEITKTEGRGWPGAPSGTSTKKDSWTAFKSSSEVVLYICVLARVCVAYSAVRKLPVHTKPKCYGTLAQAASVVEWAAKQAFDSIRQSLGLDRLLVLVGRQARSRISRMCVCVCEIKGKGEFRW